MVETSRIVLRTRVAMTVSGRLGLVLETPLNRAVHVSGVDVLRLGPDEWLLLTPADALSDLLQAAIGLPVALVDVSHRSLSVEVAGRYAVDTLSAFVALDLAETAFPIGMCTRTLLGKAEVVLWRTAVDAFHLDIGRSFEPYVRACLAEGIREYVEIN